MLGGVLPVDGVLNVRDYGAVGDGEADDTNAIQMAADAVPRGGRLHFPPGVYTITDTISFGTWTIQQNRDVIGYSGGRSGLFVTGGGDPRLGKARVVWKGPAQLGRSMVTYKDTVGHYALITDAKPMFDFIACSGVTIEGMSFDGAGKAFVGVQFDGNHRHIKVHQCLFENCYIGLRNSVGWDYVAGRVYYGHGDSPYYRHSLYDTEAYGGATANSHIYSNCYFKSCTVGYSCESAQALGVQFQSCNWSDNRLCHVGNKGGRITFIGCSFGGFCDYDIQHLTSTCVMTFIEHHTESTPLLAGFQSSTVSSRGPKLVFINSEFQCINIACGGATIAAVGSQLGVIHRSVDYDQEFHVTLEGTQVEGINLAGTSYPEKVHIAGMNIRVNSESLLSGAGAQQCRRALFNVYPASAYSIGGDQSSVASVLVSDHSIVRDTASGPRFTNTGASRLVTARLGAATIGQTFRFTRTAPHPFRIDPADDDCFRGHAAGKYLELDSDGDSATIECLTPGVWDIVAAYDPNGVDAPFDWEP